MSENTEESATSLIGLAQKLHDQYVAEGKEEKDRLIAEGKTQRDSLIAEANSKIEEAQDTHDRLIAEAQVKAENLSSDAEKQNEELLKRIESLKTFETAYRANIKKELTSLINDVSLEEL